MSAEGRHEAESPNNSNLRKSNISNNYVNTNKNKNVDYLMKQLRQDQSHLNSKIKVRVSLKPNGFSYLPETHKTSLMSVIKNVMQKRPRKRRRSKVAESMLII
jgi:hypothetical protein